MDGREITDVEVKGVVALGKHDGRNATIVQPVADEIGLIIGSSAKNAHPFLVLAHWIRESL